ncbi:MAG: hypothetical protein ACTHOD_00170 [Motilibacteraceae bacterium]
MLWLLDAGLQYQPYMFTKAFAKDVIASTAEGQPGWVAGPVMWAADLTGAHPLAWNAVFATVQLLLAVGLLWPRTVRAALAGSVAWSLGVWWLGEGLGGVASGHAMLLTGGPGAVLLYAVLAALALPRAGTGRGEPLPAAAVWAGPGCGCSGWCSSCFPGRTALPRSPAPWVMPPTPHPVLSARPGTPWPAGSETMRGCSCCWSC